MPAANVSLFYTLLPIIITILGIIILKENLTINFLLGSIIIVIGMMMAVLKKEKARINYSGL